MREATGGHWWVSAIGFGFLAWIAAGFEAAGETADRDASLSLDRARALRAQPADSTRAQSTNFLGLPAGAIDAPLVTDRPDFTESTEAVPFGRAQIEMGYTYTHDGGGDSLRQHTAPELLVRVGLVRNVELRIGWTGFVRSDTNGVIAQGGDDLTLGAKIKLLEQEGATPDFAVLVSTTVPVGAEAVSSDEYNPAIGLAWAYDLTDWLSLGGNVNFAWPTSDSGAQFFQTSASIALGLSITDQLGAFAEYFGVFDADGSGGPAHSFDTGLTYLINNNVQIDGRVGFGLNGRADDVFVGAGLAFRF